MGFFNLQEIHTHIKSTGKRLERTKAQCAQCKLHTGCLSPFMDPTGEGRLQAGVIAEAPGETEDKRNKQLVGKVGKLFRSYLLELGYSLDRDFVKTNAVSCRPPKNRKPKPKEIAYCRPRVKKFFNDNDFKLVLLLGDAAVESVIGAHWKKELPGIGTFRGFVIPDKHYNCWLAPLYHPSFVSRTIKSNPVVDKLYLEDLKNALKFLDIPFPSYKDEGDCVKFLYNTNDIKTVLKRVLEKARSEKFLFSFDYETTGIKPHAEGHSIRCVSFSIDFDEAYSFLFPSDDSEFLHLWKRILRHPRILKTAHNIKYEDTWTYHILGYRPRPWVWCTMLEAHILDNRPGITGLKFQAYIHFGLLGYDDDIEPYLKSTGGANSKNKVYLAPVHDLLLYCGIDSVVQFRLAQYQMAMVQSDILSQISNDYSDRFKEYIYATR